MNDLSPRIDQKNGKKEGRERDGMELCSESQLGIFLHVRERNGVCKLDWTGGRDWRLQMEISLEEELGCREVKVGVVEFV